jgi:hypothetical protein
LGLGFHVQLLAFVPEGLEVCICILAEKCRHQDMKISKSDLVVGEDVLILGQVDELGGVHVSVHL